MKKKSENIIHHLPKKDRFERLKIRFIDKKDLLVLSSLCQDAIFTKDEFYFDNIKNIFISTFSRFCWEYQEVIDNKIIYYRVVSGVRIFNVTDIVYENFKEEKTEFLKQ